MNVFETLASMASIISIPLAIYYARKNNSTTSEKARLDIIKTLSYRLSSTHKLTSNDIDSVYKSKLREHEIVHAKFKQEDILNDLKSDIMSNAFLENQARNEILDNLSSIELVQAQALTDSVPKIFLPFIKIFISPIPNILLIASVIAIIILLCPYIFEMIVYGLFQNNLDKHFLELHFYYAYQDDMYLHISKICFLFLSLICFFKKSLKTFGFI